jgi:hypothetical protein
MQVLEVIAPSAQLSVSNSLEEEDGFFWFKQASIANFKFALWLKERQESMKPKEFRELLQTKGILRREANKFLKLAANAKGFAPNDVAHLGPMVFSLTAPRFLPLWEALQDEGALTQNVVDALKKELFPRKTASKSEPGSIWREQPGGGKRYAQLPPIHNQETGTKFQSIMDNEVITAQKAFDVVVDNYFDKNQLEAFEAEQLSASKMLSRKQSTSVDSIPLIPDLVSPEVEAKTSRKLDIPLPSPVLENLTDSNYELPVTHPQVKVNDLAESAPISVDATCIMTYSPATESDLELEVDFASLSNALKKATNWEEIESLVQRNSFLFAMAIEDWTLQEKDKLLNHLTNYIESDLDALKMHQVDWLNMTSLEKSLKHLSYKVKNILSGLTSPWINGCQFVKVENFGKDSEEVWTFLDTTSLKEIKVCDRRDFQVIAF